MSSNREMSHPGGQQTSQQNPNNVNNYSSYNYHHQSQGVNVGMEGGHPTPSTAEGHHNLYHQQQQQQLHVGGGGDNNANNYMGHMNNMYGGTEADLYNTGAGSYEDPAQWWSSGAEAAEPTATTDAGQPAFPMDSESDYTENYSMYGTSSSLAGPSTTTTSTVQGDSNLNDNPFESNETQQPALMTNQPAANDEQSAVDQTAIASGSKGEDEINGSDSIADVSLFDPAGEGAMEQAAATDNSLFDSAVEDDPKQSEDGGSSSCVDNSLFNSKTGVADNSCKNNEASEAVDILYSNTTTTLEEDSSGQAVTDNALSDVGDAASVSEGCGVDRVSAASDQSLGDLPPPATDSGLGSTDSLVLGQLADDKGQPDEDNDQNESQEKTFFKAISFYDEPSTDDLDPFSFLDSVGESLDSIIAGSAGSGGPQSGLEDAGGDLFDESLSVPNEFTSAGPLKSQFTSMLTSSSLDASSLETFSEDGLEAAKEVLEVVLSKVIAVAIPPRKIATVHPFTASSITEPGTDINAVNSDSADGVGLRSGGGDLGVSDAVATATVSAAGDGRAPPPTAKLKLANFAVDPGGDGEREKPPMLKLANFAVDPSTSSLTASEGQPTTSSEFENNSGHHKPVQSLENSNTATPNLRHSAEYGHQQSSYGHQYGQQQDYAQQQHQQYSQQQQYHQSGYGHQRSGQQQQHHPTTTAGNRVDPMQQHQYRQQQQNAMQGSAHNAQNARHPHYQQQFPGGNNRYDQPPYGQLSQQQQQQQSAAQQRHPGVPQQHHNHGAGVHPQQKQHGQHHHAHHQGGQQGQHYPSSSGYGHPSGMQGAAVAAQKGARMGQHPQHSQHQYDHHHQQQGGGSSSSGSQSPAIPTTPSPHTSQPTPPPTHNSSACFGHFERELEYRYSFRTMDRQVHTGYVIFSSLDNVYIKLFVHETGLQGLPRHPMTWQSVYVKFVHGNTNSSGSPAASWCYLTFRIQNPDKSSHQFTVQAEVPIDYQNLSNLIQRRVMFVLSQTRLNNLNQECYNLLYAELSPYFYHVQKPTKNLRTNINNLGNECINPNISVENRQHAVKWINSQLQKHTNRNLPGRSSHIENHVYERFARQGQFLFRFIHQYYAEIRKEVVSFITQSRKEPQILELLDPQSGERLMGHSRPAVAASPSRHPLPYNAASGGTWRPPALQPRQEGGNGFNRTGVQPPTSNHQQQVDVKPTNLPPPPPNLVQHKPASHQPQPQEHQQQRPQQQQETPNVPNLPKLPPGITIKPQREAEMSSSSAPSSSTTNSQTPAAGTGGVQVKQEKPDQDEYNQPQEAGPPNVTIKTEKGLEGASSSEAVAPPAPPPLSSQVRAHPNAKTFNNGQISITSISSGSNSTSGNDRNSAAPPSYQQHLYQHQQSQQHHQYYQQQQRAAQQARQANNYPGFGEANAAVDPYYQQQRQLQIQAQQQQQRLMHERREQEKRKQALRLQQQKQQELAAMEAQKRAAREREAIMLAAQRRKREQEEMAMKQRQMLMERERMERERIAMVRQQQEQQQRHRMMQEQQQRQLMLEQQQKQQQMYRKQQQQLMERHHQQALQEQKYSSILMQQQQQHRTPPPPPPLAMGGSGTALATPAAVMGDDDPYSRYSSYLRGGVEEGSGGHPDGQMEQKYSQYLQEQEKQAQTNRPSPAQSRQSSSSSAAGEALAAASADQGPQDPLAITPDAQPEEKFSNRPEFQQMLNRQSSTTSSPDTSVGDSSGKAQHDVSNRQTPSNDAANSSPGVARRDSSSESRGQSTPATTPRPPSHGSTTPRPPSHGSTSSRPPSLGAASDKAGSTPPTTPRIAVRNFDAAWGTDAARAAQLAARSDRLSSSSTSSGQHSGQQPSQSQPHQPSGDLMSSRSSSSSRPPSAASSVSATPPPPPPLLKRPPPLQQRPPQMSAASQISTSHHLPHGLAASVSAASNAPPPLMKSSASTAVTTTVSAAGSDEVRVKQEKPEAGESATGPDPFSKPTPSLNPAVPKLQKPPTLTPASSAPSAASAASRSPCLENLLLRTSGPNPPNHLRPPPLQRPPQLTMGGGMRQPPPLTPAGARVPRPPSLRPMPGVAPSGGPMLRNPLTSQQMRYQPPQNWAQGHHATPGMPHPRMARPPHMGGPAVPRPHHQQLSAAAMALPQPLRHAGMPRLPLHHGGRPPPASMAGTPPLHRPPVLRRHVPPVPTAPTVPPHATADTAVKKEPGSAPADQEQAAAAPAVAAGEKPITRVANAAGQPVVPPPMQTTRFVHNSLGILVPVPARPVAKAVPAVRPPPPTLAPSGPNPVAMADANSRTVTPVAIRPPAGRPVNTVITRKVLVCPTCRIRFPFPEPNPETSFKANYSCHVLSKHLSGEVEMELGGTGEDLEICPADECQFNIVQMREDGVPHAETFLIKHYIEKHIEMLMPMLQDHPIYAPENCVKVISVIRPVGGPQVPGGSGLPNSKLKPIFLEKFAKFAKVIAKCDSPTECDPMHIVVFLSQWTSRRNYSLEGVKTLVKWISDFHVPIDGKPLSVHPKITEFIKVAFNRIKKGAVARPGPASAATAAVKSAPDSTNPAPKPPQKGDSANDASAEGNKAVPRAKDCVYHPTIASYVDIIKATVCSFCNQSFGHTTKLIYHLLHAHKGNPVHFINKHLRSRPVECPECNIKCMSAVTFALHHDFHEKETECETCHKKYKSAMDMYTEDTCKDNKLPKNLKSYVNSVLQRLKALDENAKMIGENFSSQYSKYAKRPYMNDLPMDYRVIEKKTKSKKKKKKKSSRPKSEDDYIPRTVEEWVLNIPMMLDARVAISMNDREAADNAIDDEDEDNNVAMDTAASSLEASSEVGEDGSEAAGPPAKRLRQDPAAAMSDAYRCNICLSEFTSAWSLNVHCRTKHIEKSLLCAACNKKFATITDLEQHMLVHKMRADPSLKINIEPDEFQRPGPKSRRVRPSLDFCYSRVPSSVSKTSTSSESMMFAENINTSIGSANSVLDSSVTTSEDSFFSNAAVSGNTRFTPMTSKHYLCEDCDGCDWDCDHEDHPVKIHVLEDDEAEDPSQALGLTAARKHALATGHHRARPLEQIRAQTDCKISLPSLAYSREHGNKIRKLWKLLAKNDLLETPSYNFPELKKCRIKECNHFSDTAMDLFRHIREAHLATLTRLKIRIGANNVEEDAPNEDDLCLPYKKPGPKSRTLKDSE